MDPKTPDVTPNNERFIERFWDMTLNDTEAGIVVKALRQYRDRLAARIPYSRFLLDETDDLLYFIKDTCGIEESGG